MTIVMTTLFIAMTKTYKMRVAFFLKSRALKDGRKPVGVQFTFSRDNQLQKLIKGLYVYPEYWNKDDERVNPKHINSQLINEELADIKRRIESVKSKHELGQISNDAVIVEVLQKADGSSIASLIATSLNKNEKSSTADSNKNWWNGFKKLVGKRNSSFTIEDLQKDDLYKKAKRIANKKVEAEEMSSRTYQNYISICTKVLNHAKDENFTYKKYTIPTDLQTTSVYRLSRKHKGISNNMFVEALKKVNTIQEWQSLALWLMSFCLRGFYYGDFVRMSDNSLVTLKLRQNDQYDKIKAPRNLFGDFYLDTLRQKSNVNILVKMERPVMRLIGMFKMSLAYTKINKKFDGKRILAHINDRIGLLDYDINKYGLKHKNMWKKFNKRSSKWGIIQAEARQTFNHYAQKINVTPEHRDIMLGHLNKRGGRTRKVHYDTYDLPEIVEAVDKAHRDTLDKFGAFELIKMVYAKLEDIVEKNNYPRWLLIQSGVHKVGREYKVLTGFENNKPIWTNIEGKYKPFFRKDESIEDGYWLDENTWFDHDNKVKKAVAKNLSSNQWIKEAKRQEGELQEAKVFDINMKQA